MFCPYLLILSKEFWFFPFLELEGSDSSVRSPSKVRGTVLPPQYELSRFISSFGTQHPSWTTYNTASAWSGVKCDAAENVISLNWDGREIDGSVVLSRLPSSLIEAHLSCNMFNGEITLSDLPHLIQTFRISKNFLNGSADLTRLPCTLVRLALTQNLMEGTISLTCLPATLTYLCLCKNRFRGELELHALPQSMRRLLLHKNQFVGVPDLRNLPPSLEYLSLESNYFQSFIPMPPPSVVDVGIQLAR